MNHLFTGGGKTRVLLGCFIAAAVLQACSMFGGKDKETEIENLNKVAALMATPPGGAVKSGRTVVLSTTEMGAAIYYTTDGSEPKTGVGEPSASSARYAVPILITEAVTIKAFALKEGFLGSDTLTESYTIEPDAPEFAAMPFATPAADHAFTPNVSIKVRLATSTEGADIYYTVDRSTPSRGSTKYEDEFSITPPTTVKAIAVKEGFTDSNVLIAAYYTVEGGGDNPDSGSNITKMLLGPITSVRMYIDNSENCPDDNGRAFNSFVNNYSWRSIWGLVTYHYTLSPQQKGKVFNANNATHNLDPGDTIRIAFMSTGDGGGWMRNPNLCDDNELLSIHAITHDNTNNGIFPGIAEIATLEIRNDYTYPFIESLGYWHWARSTKDGKTKVGDRPLSMTSKKKGQENMGVNRGLIYRVLLDSDAYYIVDITAYSLRNQEGPRLPALPESYGFGDKWEWVCKFEDSTKPQDFNEGMENDWLYLAVHKFPIVIR